MLELEATFGAPGDRELRHDRGRAPDGLEPAAAGAAQAGHRSASRPGRVVRSCDEDGTLLPAGRGRRGRDLAAPTSRPATRPIPTPTPRLLRADGGAGSAPATRASLDAEGYLRITGRLKEIINRGGEKVSPLEVDEVLMDHPAVAQVVTFAMPHDKLGEEVAAAVVLREGMVAVEQRDPHLRRRPARRLQGAAPGGDPGRDPEGRHRQAAADRARPKARPGRMRICIYGAGAIGGLLGATLARGGRRCLA